jgi:CheY-like chemotaxis protein
MRPLPGTVGLLATTDCRTFEAVDHDQPGWRSLSMGTSCSAAPLTASHTKEDIARSYALHANAYVSKPVDSSASPTPSGRSTTSS